MEVAEVRDGKSLQAYLKTLEGDAGLLTSRRVAFFAAARVLPYALDWVLSEDGAKRGVTADPVFGAIAIGGVASTWPTQPIDRAAAFAAGYAANAVAHAAHTTNSAAYSAAAAAYAAKSDTAETVNSDALAAAKAAAAGDATAWGFVRADLVRSAENATHNLPALWLGVEESEQFSKAWDRAKQMMQADAAGKWEFWTRWYERVRAGRDFHADKLAEILNPLSEDDWKKGPAHINPLFDELLALYREEDAALDKQEATVADAAYFDFVEVNRQMRAVAFPSDHEAFATDEDKAAFLKSVTALRSLLEDWCDLARAQLHGRNRPITVVVAVEQLLDQLGAIEQGKEVSLRDLVRKGSTARRTARDPALEEDLGEVLYDDLKDALDEYSELARLHLGDILAVLDALRSLELGDLDSGEVLASLKAGVARLEQEETDALLPLDVRTRAIFDDMIAELEDEQAEIAEGRTETARAQRGKRFAEKFGGVSATFGRYVEKGSAVANKGGERFDEAVKWYKRWQTLEKIVDWWNNLGGPTP